MPRLLATVFLALILVAARPLAAQVIDLDKAGPPDPLLRTGHLDNGLTFYIYKCAQPADRVILGLCVGIGSLVEEESERGLAHFLEHMAFNGTTHYPAGAVVKYLESIGSQFGADQNAFTTQDSTLFLLRVPTEQAGAVEKGVEILADFAGGIKLEGKDIDQERGVVLSELLQSKGAQDQMIETLVGLMFAGSRYAERLPRGKDEIVKNCPPDTLRAFYKKWYDPTRMAVIATGTLDPEAMEKIIRAQFSALVRPAKSAIPPPSSVPIEKQPHAAVFTHAEVPQTMVCLMHKRARGKPDPTGREGERALREGMLMQILNFRLADRAREEGAPFQQSAGTLQDNLVPFQLLEIDAVAGENGIEPALQAMLDEVQRLRQHGVTEEELARAKQQMTAVIANSRAERANLSSDAYLQHIAQAHLLGDPSHDDSWGDAVTDQVIKNTGLKDLVASLPALVGEDGWLVGVIAPEKDKSKVPAPEALAKRVSDTWSTQTVSHQDSGAVGKLMEKPPASGKVVGERKFDPPGIVEWTLDNGARVVLLPTDFKKDDVRISAVAAGGFSELPPEQYESAVLTRAVSAEGGLGPYDLSALNRVLTGHLASVGISLTASEHFLEGSSSIADLETALQILHLRFTAPAFRKDAFDRVMRNSEKGIADQQDDPNQLFSYTVRKAEYGDFPWFRQPKVGDQKSVTLELIEKIYRGYFSDASSFSFYFVGAFDPAKVKPLIETYIGSLPSRSKQPVKPVTSDPGYHFPDGITLLPVNKAMDAKCVLQLTFPNERGWGVANWAQLALAVQILQTRLLDRLREAQGQTYSVTVAQDNLYPVPKTGRVRIALVCLPENRKAITAAILEEVRRLGTQGPTDSELESARKIQLAHLEEESRDNASWLGDLISMDQMARPLADVVGQRDIVSKTTAKEVQESVDHNIPADHYLCAYLQSAFAGDADDEKKEDAPKK